MEFGFQLVEGKAEGRTAGGVEAVKFLVFAFQTMGTRSPPLPLPVGSMKPRAASTAEPPAVRRSMPICEARGSRVQTTPC